MICEKFEFSLPPVCKFQTNRNGQMQNYLSSEQSHDFKNILPFHLLENNDISFCQRVLEHIFCSQIENEAFCKEQCCHLSILFIYMFGLNNFAHSVLDLTSSTIINCNFSKGFHFHLKSLLR